jgi:hypothetical protein
VPQPDGAADEERSHKSAPGSECGQLSAAVARPRVS